MSVKKFSGLLALVLAGCTVNPESEAYGAIHDHNSPHSFAFERVGVLYVANEKNNSFRSESLLAYEPSDPTLIKHVTTKLLGEKARLSYIPFLLGQPKLALEESQTRFDAGELDSLIITDWDACDEPFIKRNMGRLYLPLLGSKNGPVKFAHFRFLSSPYVEKKESGVHLEASFLTDKGVF